MKVGIIGGGAAGMMAAIIAAKGGAEVTILEHKDRVGKKILSTGNGRCNLSNRYQSPECYRGTHPDFGWNVVQQFPVEDTVTFFQELGLCIKDKNGYLYPYSEQASAVLDLLRLELDHLGVEVCPATTIQSIKKKQNFVVQTAEQTVMFDKLILATGSKAAPVTGSDGSGYRYAKQFGHHIIKPLPALVQLHGEGDFFKAVAGVRTEASLEVLSDGKQLATERGELQLTKYGLSGIPIMQVSRYAVEALENGQKVMVQINFQPGFTKNSWLAYVDKQLEWNGYKSMEDFLLGMMNKKLIPVLCKRAGIHNRKTAWELKDKEWKRLADAILSFTVPIIGFNGFEEAQVCMGGVDTNEIDISTMESKLCKNLYLIGELLDVDGTCGGYNLQFAWSSGYLAGVACGE